MGDLQLKRTRRETAGDGRQEARQGRDAARQAQAEEAAGQAERKAASRRAGQSGAAGWISDRASEWDLDGPDWAFMERQKYLWNPLMD